MNEIVAIIDPAGDVVKFRRVKGITASAADAERQGLEEHFWPWAHAPVGMKRARNDLVPHPDPNSPLVRVPELQKPVLPGYTAKVVDKGQDGIGQSFVPDGFKKFVFRAGVFSQVDDPVKVVAARTDLEERVVELEAKKDKAAAMGMTNVVTALQGRIDRQQARINALPKVP